MCFDGFLFSEAEYAFQLRKRIIPLKMERNFQAREWLGFIIGSKFFFEFTDKYPFEDKMSGLIKEVLIDHHKSVPQKPANSKTVSDYTEASPLNNNFCNCETIFSFHLMKTSLCIHFF